MNNTQLNIWSRLKGVVAAAVAEFDVFLYVASTKLSPAKMHLSPMQTNICSKLLPKEFAVALFKYLLEQRAVLDNDGGKLLNEDHDVRPVLQYLLDDVSDFLKTLKIEGESECKTEGQGCSNILKAFIDHMSERESENFRTRRHDNKDSVTVTTIHQVSEFSSSMFFHFASWYNLELMLTSIGQANESEIPLLHEFNGITNERSNSIEVLQPSRFLREIPRHLQETQEELTNHQKLQEETPQSGSAEKVDSADHRITQDDPLSDPVDGLSKESIDTMELCNSKIFLKRFNAEDRAVVSHLFHQWAKKPAFQEPQRLLKKHLQVGFVIDERLRVKKSTHKLHYPQGFQYSSFVPYTNLPATFESKGLDSQLK
ncbi:hypothetical protein BC332_28360 [Capsicum chinense]|nr:hypothetical protein BC332_28360 [Capsicum chinense]